MVFADTSPEEALAAVTAGRAVVFARCPVSTYGAQEATAIRGGCRHRGLCSLKHNGAVSSSGGFTAQSSMYTLVAAWGASIMAALNGRHHEILNCARQGGEGTLLLRHGNSFYLDANE